MTNASARLARSITWGSSKQSYLTARSLADRDLADDCLRAYAYFRWADDMIDITLAGDDERTSFIARQKMLITELYRGWCPGGLSPEEEMLADLIAHDRIPEGGLHSFIHNFMAVIEYDAHRHGRIATRQELTAYTTCLATAVMDGIQYFIGNGHPYPKTHDRVLAVTGAHITHMLRDLREDLSAGLVNIPDEQFKIYQLDLQNINNQQFRLWVREQVEQARFCFREGKAYIDSLDVLRCKLAGVWYCARFECVLKAIERDGYQLRMEYPERHSLKVWLEMVRLAADTTWKHFTQRLQTFFFRPEQPAGLNLPSYHVKQG